MTTRAGGAVIDAASRPDESRGPSRFLPAALLCGLAVRVYAAATALAPTFDTATVGVMALHILKGERPLFYYGQNYMGALEAYVAAGLFALFGKAAFVLALSPILFSVAWIYACWLLFRELGGPRAGLAAALCAAVPGWETLWYSIGSYGGYPAAFLCGTLALWLCLRIALRDLSPRALWVHAIALGGVSALGLWTHYSAAFYLLTGAVPLTVRVVRRRFALPFLGKLAVGCALALLGMVPALLSYQEFSGEQVLQWHFSWGFVKHNIRMLLDENLPRLLFWPWDRSPAPPWKLARSLLHAVPLLCLAAGSLLFLRILWDARRDAARLVRLLVPPLFCAVFLGAYLPHFLASLNAPRYAIPLVSMVTAAVLALPLSASRRLARRISAALLAAWLLYNGVSAAFIGIVRAPRAADAREAFATVAGKVVGTGIETVMMVGGPIFGHEGQVLDLYARDKARFVSVFDERYQPWAQAAEAAPRVALACPIRHLPRLEATLDSLRVSCAVLEDPWVSVLHELRVPPRARRSVAAAALTVALDGPATGEAGHLTDRVRETAVEGPYGAHAGFTADAGREILLDSLWLYAPDPLQLGLPDTLRVAVSLDGREFAPLAAVSNRLAAAYICGEQVYMMGYFGMLECRFDPVRARYVRLEFEAGQRDRQTWQISEVHLFEAAADPGSPSADAAAIASAVRERNVGFTVCDRWLSAKLIEALPRPPGAPPAYPRFNPKFKATRMSRLLNPVKGKALAVERAVADDCEEVLRRATAGRATWERRDFAHYSLLVFTNEPPAAQGRPRLLWNGHTLLTTAEPEGKWF